LRLSEVSAMSCLSCKCGPDCDGEPVKDLRDDGREEHVDMSRFSKVGGLPILSTDTKKDTPPPIATPSAPKGRAPFDVEITREGEHWRSIGLVVSPDDDPRYLFVDTIRQPSLVEDWNKEHSVDQQIFTGDIITSVNGISSSGEAMLDQLKTIGKGGTMKLRIEN